MQQPHATAPKLLTALEVQSLLHVDRSTVYRMAEDGRLPALRVGRSWRFPAERIAALLRISPTDPDSDAAGAGTGAGAGAGAEAAGAAAPTPGTATALPHHPTPPVSLVAPIPTIAALPATPAPIATSPTGGLPISAPGARLPETGPTPRAPVSPASAPTLDTGAARAAIEVAAELLGVMMVVTDMAGRPVTEVVHPCVWFAQHGADPDVLDQCVAEWRDLADHPDLTPRFAAGVHGFECARAFVRNGPTLVGMVLAGGVSPSPEPGADPDLYHLGPEQREQVLDALPLIAAAISRATPERVTDAPGRTTRTRRPAPVAPTKETP